MQLVHVSAMLSSSEAARFHRCGQLLGPTEGGDKDRDEHWYPTLRPLRIGDFIYLICYLGLVCHSSDPFGSAQAGSGSEESLFYTVIARFFVAPLLLRNCVLSGQRTGTSCKPKVAALRLRLRIVRSRYCCS